jgi:DNA-binding NarL/FixJ family response regulator
MYQGDEDVCGALDAGAVTYLLKETVSDDLIRVIRDVHAGRPVANPFLDQVLAVSGDHPRLTARERQVIELVAQGLRNRDIGAALGVRVETIEVHLRHIYDKLDVSDRTSAVKIATRRGIIHVE